jgi:hypothetical protein
LSQSVVLIHLRRPRGPDDGRDDPFWEFGSFGCTGCHARQVGSGQLDGTRLGFIQGGADTLRLVYLTPPVQTIYGSSGAMVEWRPHEMPFRFEEGPLLMDRSGETDFPRLRSAVEHARRSTWLGRFSSSFRSRTLPLSPEQAAEVIAVCERARASASATCFASHYFEAIPDMPMDRTRDRRERYRKRLEKAGIVVP